METNKTKNHKSILSQLRYLVSYLYPKTITGWLLIAVCFTLILKEPCYLDGIIFGIWISWAARNIIEDRVR